MTSWQSLLALPEGEPGFLGFKGLKWVTDGVFVSPLHSFLQWPQSGIADAECLRPELRCQPVPDDWPMALETLYYHLPGLFCTCGIYGSFYLEPVHKDYAASAFQCIVLIESAGRTLLYDNCWRAEQALVRALVDDLSLYQYRADPIMCLGRQHIMAHAQQHFGIEMIGALSATRLVNERHRQLRARAFY